MPDAAAGERNPSIDTPRSPVSLSAESGQQTFSKPSHLRQDSASPTSPPGRSTRKRPASPNSEASTNPSVENLVLDGAKALGTGAVRSDSAREQVCLCQPDPKIPRPRNAFILFRQHYQAQVVAQHPGLANPDISKIIGEQWREQPAEVKDEWKRLAEEEKQRHQRQYPGYRYQPRRAGRQLGNRSAVVDSSNENPGRCSKCSGRYISTPGTPLTPFVSNFNTASNSRNDQIPIPSTPLHQPNLTGTSVYSDMQGSRSEAPRPGVSQQQQAHGRPFPQIQPGQKQTHYDREDEMALASPSPDQKRRRYNNEPHRGYISPPAAIPSPSHFAPSSSSHYRSHQLPGPGMLVHAGSMGPPPQNSPTMHQTRQQYSQRPQSFDESLRLPPLQTQTMSAPIIPDQKLGPRNNMHESQYRSVQDMVMSIPYLNKMKVLSKISPPLAPSRPAHPAYETRGVVVAVEGTEQSLVMEVGNFINEYLVKESSVIVNTWATGEGPHKQTNILVPDTRGVEPGAPLSSSLNPHDTVDKSPYLEYLSVISEWHMKSPEIVKYLTESLASQGPATADTASKILPIALLPRGFSLTISDRYALQVPINDFYTAVDHWQWMATLWRGIVGVDLTILVKRTADREEVERLGAVEVRGDCAAIIVRIMQDTNLDEKTARRLGFEVLEFVRGIEGSMAGARMRGEYDARKPGL